jgi:hypothetical protein
MRKWGVVITLVYSVILIVLFLPGFIALGDPHDLFGPYGFGVLRETYTEWSGMWVVVAALIFGEATLMFLAVDTSQKRLRPRAHIAVSATMAGMLLTLMVVVGAVSLSVAMDSGRFLYEAASSLSVIAGLWIFWGVVFYLYARKRENVVKRVATWLIRASVLELLVAVPCHVIVRRRMDCSAPLATSLGICTGIAVMLLSFGPGVLLLYKKRMDTYGARKDQIQQAEQKV